MAEPLSRAGGRRKLNANEKVIADTFRQVGALAEQGYLNVLAARLFGNVSGVLGNDCAPSQSGGDLDWEMTEGLAFVKDTGETDVFEPIYKPIPVDVAQGATLAAHDGSFARKDLLSIGPATVDEEEVSRQIFTNPSGPFVPTDVDTHTRRTFELTVTTGTPAGSPSLPSTPAGHIQIAEFNVPAVAGTMTVVDLRTALLISQVDLAQVDTADLVDLAVTGAKIANFAVGTNQIVNASVTARKMSKRSVVQRVTNIGAESGNIISVTMFNDDLDAVNVDRTQRLKLTVYNDDGEVKPADAIVTHSSGGALLSANSKGRIIIETPNTNAPFIVLITDLTAALAGNLWLEVVPVSDESNTVQPGHALLVKLVFA